MDPGLQPARGPGAPCPDPAMHVPPEPMAGHLGTTTRSYFCLTTATLALCLIFTVATIMVLVVQRTDSVPSPPDNFPLKGEKERVVTSMGIHDKLKTVRLLGDTLVHSLQAPKDNYEPHFIGNCSEDLLCILKRTPFKKSWAYLQVSKHLNNTKLSWNKDGIVHGVRYQDGDLVIQFPGWYFIICQLQFLVQCSNHSMDLKLELLVNREVKKQAMVTVCDSGIQTKNIYQNLSQFLLDYLPVNTTISVMVDKFQYVDTITFPLENVLSVFLYSGSD